jgi:hypothetical protein
MYLSFKQLAKTNGFFEAAKVSLSGGVAREKEINISLRCLFAF